MQGRVVEIEGLTDDLGCMREAELQEADPVLLVQPRFAPVVGGEAQALGCCLHIPAAV